MYFNVVSCCSYVLTEVESPPSVRGTISHVEVLLSTVSPFISLREIKQLKSPPLAKHLAHSSVLNVTHEVFQVRKFKTKRKGFLNAIENASNWTKSEINCKISLLDVW